MYKWPKVSTEGILRGSQEKMECLRMTFQGEENPSGKACLVRMG